MAIFAEMPRPTRPSLAFPTAWNNHSCHYPSPPPSSVAPAPLFESQIRVNSPEINKNDTGWEECPFLA